MKKIILLIIILSTYTHTYSSNNKAFKFDLGLTSYGVNIAFAGVDINIGIPFHQKGFNILSFQTTLLTYIPSSVLQKKAPYILFGGLWELQYNIILKNGFLFGLETGLGIASEFFQEAVYIANEDFKKNFISSPYGLFSSGLRMGYDFSQKFKLPLKLAAFMGYRMQFPYNFTVKHFILYGVGLAYSFNFGEKNV